MNNNDINNQTDDLETQNTMNRIYTIGHSNYEIDKFIQLLKGHDITAVYDVRSMPYSRYVPQFNQGSIKQSLIHTGIDYVYLGKELGPFSKDPNCCIEGIVQYDLIAQTKSFRDGLSRIKKDAMIYNLALMCAEKEPAECHRMILVCRHLRGENIEIKHILEDGSLEDNRDTEQRLMKILKISDEILFEEIEDPVERAYEEMGRRNAFKHRNDTPQGHISTACRYNRQPGRPNLGMYRVLVT
jgi:uncharacterized protein (DUF488 family)